jgi:hypothetical protein
MAGSRHRGIDARRMQSNARGCAARNGRSICGFEKRTSFEQSFFRANTCRSLSRVSIKRSELVRLLEKSGFRLIREGGAGSGCKEPLRKGPKSTSLAVASSKDIRRRYSPRYSVSVMLMTSGIISASSFVRIIWASSRRQHSSATGYSGLPSFFRCFAWSFFTLPTVGRSSGMVPPNS